MVRRPYLVFGAALVVSLTLVLVAAFVARAPRRPEPNDDVRTVTGVAGPALEVSEAGHVVRLKAGTTVKSPLPGRADVLHNDRGHDEARSHPHGASGPDEGEAAGEGSPDDASDHARRATREEVDVFTPTETSKDQIRHIAGRTLYLEPGFKYRILVTVPPNPNGRDFTAQESRRHMELHDRLRAHIGSDGEIRGLDDAELRGIMDELAQLRAISRSLGGEARGIIWNPAPGVSEPPDSEAILVDLRTTWR